MHIHRPISFLAPSQERYERRLFFRQGALSIILICPNFIPRTGPQQLKDVPLDEDFFHFAHGWTRLIRISGTLWFKLLPAMNSHFALLCPGCPTRESWGTPPSVFLFLASGGNLISIDHFLLLKSFTIFTRESKSTERRVNSWINYSRSKEDQGNLDSTTSPDY